MRSRRLVRGLMVCAVLSAVYGVADAQNAPARRTDMAVQAQRQAQLTPQEQANQGGAIVAKVGPNGEVLSATPQGGGGLGTEVVDCVVRRVKSASFAPPEGGGATIVIPVTFALQK
jgi:hypothetical protein